MENERASVSKQKKSSSKSNKRSASDKSKRQEYVERHWHAVYTRADGTKVKRHYVTKSYR